MTRASGTFRSGFFRMPGGARKWSRRGETSALFVRLIPPRGSLLSLNVCFQESRADCINAWRNKTTMSTEVVMSVAVLLATAIAGFLAARMVLHRLRARATIFLLVAVLVASAVVGILF